MGKAISLLRPPQPPRENERDMVMELRKRPRPPRVDPDFVSSPPLRKRVRKQAAARKPREAAGAAKRQPPRKRPRCACMGIGNPAAGLHPATCGRQAPPRMSTRVLFRPRHPFNWYEPDMWTEVAKHLCGCDLLRLSRTCRWFRRLLADDSIWRYAFFRDLNLPAANLHAPLPLHRSWRSVYFAAFDGSHAYCCNQSDKHLSSLRVGAFLLDLPKVLLTGKLPLPWWLLLDADGVQLSIEVMGACVLNNARPGVWIADMHVMRCPVCSLNSCRGTMQVLDARHSELFLEEAYWDGTMEYEDLGEHILDEEATAAFCAVVNHNHLSSPSAAFVLSPKSWIGKRDDPLTKKCATTYAAAINTNLQHNGGTHSS
ncbi:probable F-box protein At5g36000 [Phragmites australis]|uniref:probable F-box protein At5g36000 n=1 Tax=Phragmites australis TaxID=29695 RepID=UPI002D78A121|nr:probable F-box protein At5g36000 [Phragmites australis]